MVSWTVMAASKITVDGVVKVCANSTHIKIFANTF